MAVNIHFLIWILLCPSAHSWQIDCAEFCKYFLDTPEEFTGYDDNFDVSGERIGVDVAGLFRTGPVESYVRKWFNRIKYNFVLSRHTAMDPFVLFTPPGTTDSDHLNPDIPETLI